MKKILHIRFTEAGLISMIRLTPFTGIFLMILALVLLTGCSSGGGGGNGTVNKSPPANPAAGSTWDQMVWDQGQWG
jgi:hypothetical protein